MNMGIIFYRHVLIGASPTQTVQQLMCAIYGIYVNILYVYMYGMSHPRAASQTLYRARARARPHAIFCAEKSALKNNCDSML